VSWSAWCQFKIGKGTPVPIVPTRKLIITGPYKYCRNPMASGIIVYYLGIALFETSFSALFLIVLFSVLLIIYIKLIEERELEARFGEEYKTYKKNMPFIIPKVRRQKE